jgi:DnaJ family protein A protein 5
VIEWREEIVERSPASRLLWHECPVSSAPVPPHYKSLEVGVEATLTEVKQAYRRLALEVHPDRQAPAERAKAERLMQQLNEAYAVLGDARQRAIYDRTHSLDQA